MLKSFSAVRWKENENKNYSMYNLLAQSILFLLKILRTAEKPNFSPSEVVKKKQNVL